jgi:hypothetical protein
MTLGMWRRRLRSGGRGTKEDIRALKTLAREKTKTNVIARKLKRSVDSTYQQASKLGVMLGGGRGKKGA